MYGEVRRESMKARVSASARSSAMAKRRRKTDAHSKRRLELANLAAANTDILRCWLKKRLLLVNESKPSWQPIRATDTERVSDTSRFIIRIPFTCTPNHGVGRRGRYSLMGAYKHYDSINNAPFNKGHIIIIIIMIYLP